MKKPLAFLSEYSATIDEKIIPFVLDVLIYSSSNNDSDDGVVPAHEEHEYKTLTNTKQ